jgi:hypothetical protein
MAKQPKEKTKNSVEKRKTIIVTDPKDKRLRAYNDSNQNYKNFIEDVNYEKSKGSKFIGINPIVGGMEYKNPNYGSVIISPKKKPVQPYKLEKKKPVVKTPVKPVEKTVVKAEVKPAQKPVVKEEKTLYQGRNFMDSTGLRPNLYTKSEVANAARLIKEKKAKDKK